MPSYRNSAQSPMNKILLVVKEIKHNLNTKSFLKEKIENIWS